MTATSDGTTAGRRCPSCGALVADDATWCGQCYTDLREPEPTREQGAAAGAVAGLPAPPRARQGDADDVAPWWPCRACGGRNPIELDACSTCGTPFAQLMREEPERPDVEPRDAVAWSLVFPGLGHRLVGRPFDGLARGVLFVVSFVMALLVGFGGVRSGVSFGVFALFLLTALVVYTGTAFEAHRLAEGGELLLSSRALLWILVGVIMLSVGMLAFAVTTAVRR